MSYSFNIRATDKEDARAKVAEEMAKVVVSQPIHANDKDAAQAAADAMLGVIRDDAAQDITVSVSGYVSWNDAGISTASVNVCAALAAKVVTAEAA